MGNQCSRKGENAISAKLYFKIFRGSTPPYPSSSSHLRRSRLGPPINLTLLRHCFHALNTDVTFTINCEMLVHTLFCDLTQRLAFRFFRVFRVFTSLVAGQREMSALKNSQDCLSLQVVLCLSGEQSQIKNGRWVDWYYVIQLLNGLSSWTYFGEASSILQSSKQGHLNIQLLLSERTCGNKRRKRPGYNLRSILR